MKHRAAYGAFDKDETTALAPSGAPTYIPANVSGQADDEMNAAILSGLNIFRNDQDD